MFICQNDEGLHAYLVQYWRGTYASVGMLKGYMVRERLGTPGLNYSAQSFTFYVV